MQGTLCRVQVLSDSCEYKRSFSLDAINFVMICLFYILDTSRIRWLHKFKHVKPFSFV